MQNKKKFIPVWKDTDLIDSLEHLKVTYLASFLLPVRYWDKFSFPSNLACWLAEDFKIKPKQPIFW